MDIVLLVCCGVLFFSSVALLVLFLRAKKAQKTQKILQKTMEKAYSMYDIKIDSLEESVKEERSNAEEMLERAANAETKFEELSRIYGKNITDYEKLQQELEAWKVEASKQLSQRKSSEVRTGKITEHIAGFLEDFPVPASSARFIGDPIDLVSFCLDEDVERRGVFFIEVKSGNSQLSQKQRKIKQLIEEGRVYFETYRVRK